MENNKIYAEMRRRINLAIDEGREQTVVLVFRPTRHKHKGILGSLADQLFGLQIDTVPDNYEDCDAALKKLAHDGYKISYYRTGLLHAPYCAVVVNDISLLDENRV